MDFERTSYSKTTTATTANTPFMAMVRRWWRCP